MKVLDRNLPIWLSEVDDGEPSERLDNNWYSPAAHYAELEINRVARGGAFRLVTLGKLCEEHGINTGGAPDEEGEVGLIEGRNLRANYVIPLFTKFGEQPMDIKVGDLLIGKDGEPGTAALITQALLDYCKVLTVGAHVYHIRLQPEYRSLAPFISAFFNSRMGPAILRKRIAGGTTPTIRKSDLVEVPTLIPLDQTCPSDIADAVIQTQKSIIASMGNLGPSEGIVARLGVKESDVRLPTNWAGGGALRSSRILA